VVTNEALGKQIELGRTPSKRQSPLESAPFQTWAHPDGTIWALFYHNPDGYIVRFPRLADFAIAEHSQRITIYPAPGVAAPTIDHLYLNQVLPLAASRQPRLVLHGSAVELGEAAVAFLGGSGLGKSTLTASFAANGYRFLTDDGLQLECAGDRHTARPSHPSIRLWDDSRSMLIPDSVDTAATLDYTSKARLLADGHVGFCDAPRRLAHVYLLADAGTDSITISPAAGREAIIETVRHSFILDVAGRETLTRHFGMVRELVQRVQFSRLAYPRRYARLAAVREAVIAHTGSHDPTARRA